MEKEERERWREETDIEEREREKLIKYKIQNYNKLVYLHNHCSNYVNLLDFNPFDVRNF